MKREGLKNFFYGFSLVELIVVMSIITTLIGLITINLANTQQRASLKSVFQTLISDVRQQQIKAMVGDTQGGATSDSYGIHIDSNKYVLFKGTSYDALASSNFKVDLPTNVQFVSPVLDIVFDRVSGDARFSTLTNGLVGYWRFNEGTGQIANDSSGSNNNGTLGANSSAASDDPTWTSGKPGLGGALDFAGTSDFVNIPDNNSLDLFTGGQLTASFWIMDLNAAISEGIIDKATTTVQWFISWDNTIDGLIEGCLNGVCATSNTGSSLDNGNWHHIVFVADDVANEIALWVDGNKQIDTDVATPLGNNVNPLRIGHPGPRQNDFGGRIDEVRIYSRALSALEIYFLYAGTQFKLQDTTNSNTKTIQVNEYGVVTGVN